MSAKPAPYATADFRQLCHLSGGIEAVFRCLTSELGHRPIFHRKEARADGHPFMTVLAYQFVQLVRRRLAAQGIPDSWALRRARLNGQVRVTASFRRSDGRVLAKCANHPDRARAVGDLPGPRSEPGPKRCHQDPDLTHEAAKNGAPVVPLAWFLTRKHMICRLLRHGC